MKTEEILKLLLPAYLIEYFDVVKFEEIDGLLHLYFEEKNTTPKEFSSLQLQSKGFHEEIAVDDFPLRELAHWFKEVEESGFKSFSILKNTITHHYNDILNYFNTRSTNASAESFNAKIKNF
ncbi:ISAon1 family transposase N-terminal region protein, partial [Chryseobacterium sp.]|uniref:ISAon1 family transposase N-terminal region protein n=1 Tax=Chryseobacterium sp. TaxID=1871047 RepID=UPI002FC71826